MNIVNILRLSERRLYFKLAQVYRFIHDLSYFHDCVFLEESHVYRYVLAPSIPSSILFITCKSLYKL